MNVITLKHIAAGFCFGAMITTTSVGSATAVASEASQWVDAWSAPPDSAGPSLQAKTIRQIVRTSIGGTGIRVRLSNLYGTTPVTIGPVHIAVHADGASIRPGTDHALTFAGKPTVTVARGTDVLSDPVAFPVNALEELAVSMYLPVGTGASTTHLVGNQAAFITPRGDAVAATTFPVAKMISSRYFLTDVEVAAVPTAHTLVAVGDSITDGVGSTMNSNARWPDALASRLQADPALAAIAVVDAGIAGNRILHDGADPFLGPSALSRFDRDASNKAGVRWVLLLEGINDITAADVLATPVAKVSPQQIIDGMKALIERAHAKGLKIWGATLTPYAGAGAPFYTARGEAKRQAVNQWIRSASAFDAVVDFDRVIRDPAHSDHILPSFDSGDHLHPNDAGYKAMAAVIDLQRLASDK